VETIYNEWIDIIFTLPVPDGLLDNNRR